MSTDTASRLVDPLLVDEPGRCEHLLGNEAIVRGALEAGVTFASGYPGTPSSEITDSFARVAGERGLVFEYSVNEKIALEMAFAASLAGARSICAMKHLGLMVAGDPLSTIPYIGVEAGMVIVSAGDPSCRTSPNEQDQRRLGPMLHIPVLDPSTPDRARAMTRFAFELSERSRLPVLLRPTTSVCHARAPVRYGPMRAPEVRGFVRDPKRYVPIPVNARRMRVELFERIGTARAMIAACTDPPLLHRSGNGSAKTAVLASGAPAATCSDVLAAALADVGADPDTVALWTLGAVFPLPEAELIEALRDIERLLVVEELSAFIEDAVFALAARHGVRVEILGKRSGHLPEAFEYTPAIVQAGLYDALGVGRAPQPQPEVALPEQIDVPPRPPSLCPGCPHRSAYFAARAAFDEDQLYFNDIGCYTLGYGEPLDTVDALLCMGAGFTLAAGVARVTGKRTVGFLGDSTFFHSGMPALVNVLKENVNMVAVILDNRVTAMTGFQPSQRADPSIEQVVRALGARHVEHVDPYELPTAIAAFRRARDASGVSVVIVDRACPVHDARRGGTRADAVYEIDPSRCRTCGRAASSLQCTQCLTKGFEQHLARQRSTQERDAAVASPMVAPCSTACPLSLCVQGYSGQIAAGNYEAALAHVLDRTPLAESVCRVCHRPCESACVRVDIDSPVAINDLKRFVVEWAATQEQYPYTERAEPAHGKRVAVIGAGPAGLGGALELALRGYEVTMFDGASRPGGLLDQAIPSYRLPRERLQRDVDRVLAAGVRFVGETRLGEQLQLDELLDGEDAFDAVLLAIGAHRERQLDVPGVGAADGPGVIGALSYLSPAGEARSLRGARVVVVGGGNAAIDASRTALRRGADEVALVCFETREAMPALPEEVLAAEAEGVRLHTERVCRRVEQQHVVAAALADGGTLADGDAPADGGTPAATASPVALAPSDSEADDVRLAADLLVVAIGQDPDLAALDSAARATPLERGDDGCLRVDAHGATSNPRVFASGDLVSPADRTVTAAIGSGQRAAWGIDRALRGEQAANQRTPPKVPERHPRSRWMPTSVAPRPRNEPHRAPPSARAASFVEVVGKLDERAARAEAERCLVCGKCANCRVCIDLCGCPAFREQDGRIVIDAALCNGCGVCARFCPNDAIVARPREGAL